MITLTTDFGLKDPYVAEMKAVILSICPNAVIVDITHEVEKFNIRSGAFMLSSAVPYFPENAIHVGVIDPGVGTRRRSVVIQTRRGFFIGPDNGLLVLAAEKQGIICIRELANPRFMLPKISYTFHARDVFAPAAAHLTNGIKVEEFGPEIRKVVQPEFTKVIKRKDGWIGEILHVDDFGNIVTNINEEAVTQSCVKNFVSIELPCCKLKLKLCRTYAETKPQEPLILIGSQGFLEISLNQGNAAETFKAKPGDKIKLLL